MASISSFQFTHTTLHAHTRSNTGERPGKCTVKKPTHPMITAHPIACERMGLRMAAMSADASVPRSPTDLPQDQLTAGAATFRSS